MEKTEPMIPTRALATTLALALAAAGCASRTTAADPDVGAASTAARPKIGAYTSPASGFDTHSFWVDTGREVVVVDAQFTPAEAEKVVAQIRKETKSPIAWVVVTHPNPDKFDGAPVFQALGAKLVTSKATALAMPGVHAYKKAYFVGAGMFTDATYPALPKPDVTFEGDMDLPLAGGAKVTLHELAHAGVSTTQTVVSVPAAGALFVGDLVHHGAHAWLEGGIDGGKPRPDLAAWKLALGELRAFSGATVYGGRGREGKVEEVVPAQIEYLDRMDRIVTDYVAGLGPRRSELSGPKAGEHWKAIAGLAQKAYPDRDLAYLVEYGVYGLALSR